MKAAVQADVISAALLCGLLILNLSDFANGYAAPSGLADTNFSRPHFTQTEFPGRVTSDARGGLFWTFVNGATLDDANLQRLGGVIRTFESGIADTNFQVGPVLPQTWAVAVEADGKILVSGAKAGDFTSNAVPNYRIFQLFTNGAFDLSYNSPLFDNLPRAMSLQPDGKLVVGGWAATQRQGNGGIIDTVRLNTNGTLDLTFTSPIIAGRNGIIFAPPVIDAAGKILLGGSFTTVNGTPCTNICRLLTNGMFDASFVPAPFATLASSQVRGIVVQTNGQIVVAGGRFRLPGNSTNYALMRFNTNGSLDNTFTLVQAETAGFTPSVRIYTLRQTPDFKLLGVGNTVARFNSDGTLDNSFTRNVFSGGYFNGTCTWMELLSSGKTVATPVSQILVGTSTVPGPFQLNSDGTLDLTFSPPTFNSESFPTDASAQAGGKLLVWGVFDRVGAVSRHALVRLNSDGTLDPTYNFSAFTNLLGAGPVAVAPDNSLYAILNLGTDPLFDGAYSLVHILANGQLDTSFQPTNQIDTPVAYVQTPGVFLQNGKPLLWYNTEQDVVNGSFPFFRLNTNGSVDSSFIGSALTNNASANPLGLVQRDGTGTITNVVVGLGQVLAAYSNGQLIGIGSGDAVNYYLRRLNSDGTIDTSFNGPALPGRLPVASTTIISDPLQSYATYQVTAVSAGPSPVSSAQILSNGTVLVAGYFSRIGGYSIAGLARLQSSGTVDASFPGGSGAALLSNTNRPARVDTVTLDSQGRIWITGNFDHFNGTAVKGVARLNSNGSVDTTFVSQAGYYDYTFSDARSSSVALNTDGSVCLLGPYSLIGEAWPSAATRLIDYGPPILSHPVRVGPGQFGFTLAGWPGINYTVLASTSLPTPLSNWFTLAVTNLSGNSAFVSDNQATNAQRYYRAKTGS